MNRAGFVVASSLEFLFTLAARVALTGRRRARAWRRAIRERELERVRPEIADRNRDEVPGSIPDRPQSERSPAADRA